MAFSSQEAKEGVLTLRDRLKHGQNMTKILESQLETAQQNISLLQGQVRLANETILNLKKYFQETENTVNELLTSSNNNNKSSSSHKSSRVFHFNDTNSSSKNEEHHDRKHLSSAPHSSSRKSSRSPISPEPVEPRAPEDRREQNNKSPYEQQLRQVLDALHDDEEPKKAMYRQLHERDHDEHQQQQTSHSRPSSSSSSHKPSYNSENESVASYHRSRTVEAEEYSGKSKHRTNGHPSHREITSPKQSSFYRGQTEMVHHHRHQHPQGHPHHQNYHPSSSNHCLGPCCQSEPSPGNGYKMVEKPPPSLPPHHYVENEKPHYIEKSPSGGVRYIAMHSPEGVPIKHGADAGRHHGHHYVSYAYHMPAEATHKAIHDMAQPLSPTGRRKRSYVPLVPNEEPPHLKYTKVKRIDGSKLTAQKVLQGIDCYYSITLFFIIDCNNLLALTKIHNFYINFTKHYFGFFSRRLSNRERLIFRFYQTTIHRIQPKI